MIDTVLIDLGETLVQYMDKDQFPTILEEAIASVGRHLRAMGLVLPQPAEVMARTAEQNHEAVDFRVRKLEDRLKHIFDLPGDTDAQTLNALCGVFMEPVFARGRMYGDAIPCLRELRSVGLRTVIVSNTAWGSPAGLWKREVERHGLHELVDGMVFCRDSGWRKPSRSMFDYVTAAYGIEHSRCVFVGDNPVWDVQGPEAAGIKAILVDRGGGVSRLGHTGMVIGSLRELPHAIMVNACLHAPMDQPLMINDGETRS